jgi:glutamyl-tRNA synthetase
MAANSLFFFRAPISYDEKAVRKHVAPEVVALLNVVAQELSAVAQWNAPAIHSVISSVAARENLALGKLAQPIRLAMCGGTISPPIDATLAILGKEEALSRLATAGAVWGAV